MDWIHLFSFEKWVQIGTGSFESCFKCLSEIMFRDSNGLLLIIVKQKEILRSTRKSKFIFLFFEHNGSADWWIQSWFRIDGRFYWFPIVSGRKSSITPTDGNLGKFTSPNRTNIDLFSWECSIHWSVICRYNSSLYLHWVWDKRLDRDWCVDFRYWNRGWG